VNSEPDGLAEGRRRLLVLAFLALIAGAASGLLGAVFRLALERADRFRDSAVAWAHGETLAGSLLIISVAAAATALAAWLVRRFSPDATGSGIPVVEAELQKEQPEAPLRLIPVKFMGGVLAIGAGLALGREGPTIQMGASLGHLFGTTFRRDSEECRALLAAGAGAGLATAFNAPIAGAVFVLEELVRRFETRITITTLGASAGAIAVARVLLGTAPDFPVGPLPYSGLGAVPPVHIALGIVASFVGVAYNRALLLALAAAKRLHRLRVELRAALVGAMVGLLACSRPPWSAVVTPSPSARWAVRRCSPRLRSFSCYFRTWAGVLRGGDAGRVVCAHAGVGVADWSSLRDPLRQLVPRGSHQSDGIGRGWNGRIFHRRSACSGYRDYPGH
jgi:chloride channel protein, CIC family